MAYKLQYSEDGVNFYYYKVPGQSSPKVHKLPCVTYLKIFGYIPSQPVENEPLSGQKSVDTHVASLFELNNNYIDN